MLSLQPDVDSAHRIYVFDDYVLDIGRGTLLRAEKDVALRPKPFKVLHYLVENHGRLVSKNELLDAIWGHKAVTEGALTHCIIDIRKAIGDATHDKIRTLPRRGYIFDVAVEYQAADLPASQRHRPHGHRAARSLWSAAVAMMLVVAAAAVWWTIAQRSPSAATATVSQLQRAQSTIAVLPFVDMSTAQDQQHFGDGMSEEILNLLARTPALRVIARTSSFAYKGRNADIATIARELDVSHILEGSIRRAGNRIRITTQLVDASTSLHLWSKTYDRNTGNSLSIQSEIAEAVAEVLRVKLAARGPDAADRPRNAEAHERLLRARFFYHRRAPGDIERARKYFEDTLRIDPDYADAWAGIAGVYMLLSSNSRLPDDQALALQREAVQRALEIDTTLAEAHIRAAQLHWRTGNNQAASKHYRIARDLNPNSPLVLSVGAGNAAYPGDVEEAIALQ